MRRAIGVAMDKLFFEDFAPGATTTFGHADVTEASIVDYARRFDPQPFHVDPEAAKASFAGRLIASGWHTIAMQMRMLCDAWLLESAAMGSPGIDEVKWLKPVLPGHSLSVRQTVLDTKPSRSRPEMGVVQFRLETLNQKGEVVMVQTNPIMFARRGTTQTASGQDTAPTSGIPAGMPNPAPTRRSDATSPSGGSGASGAGATEILGEHTFEADEIVAFARAFDPQPFHVDPEEGARSHFGGLVASGWHTAAMWMSLLVAQRKRAVEEATSQGLTVPRYGPSPGFTDLRWLKPVRVGDTIRYATRLVDKRPSATRPGWGLIFTHNTGHNQAGDKVFEFKGSGFVGLDGSASRSAPGP